MRMLYIFYGVHTDKQPRELCEFVHSSSKNNIGVHEINIRFKIEEKRKKKKKNEPKYDHRIIEEIELLFCHVILNIL